MSITTLVMLAFLGGAVLQFLTHRWAVAVAMPTIALGLWILFTEFLVPYKGGGASMWPIALFFVVAYSAVGSFSGAWLMSAILKMVKPK